MKLSSFFRISWTLQLLVGLGLFAVSLLIQYTVLGSFIATPLLALLLAIALEAGKAASIIWHRYLTAHELSSQQYPKSTQLASASFRLGLVCLSAICSLLYLSGNLDRPFLQEVKAQDLTYVEEQKTQGLNTIQMTIASRQERLQQQQYQEIELLKESQGRRVKELQTALKAEMNNVINGTFKGPRYQELESQMNLANQNYQNSLTTLRGEHQEQLERNEAALAEFDRQERERIQKHAETKRLEIQNDDYVDDERANDPLIVAFLKMSQSVFAVDFLPLQFVFVFSLLISLLMEIGIMLAFETITVAILPVVSAQHKETLESEVLETQLDGERARDEANHKAAVSKIRSTADRVMEKANEYLSASNPSSTGTTHDH